MQERTAVVDGQVIRLVDGGEVLKKRHQHDHHHDPDHHHAHDHAHHQELALYAVALLFFFYTGYTISQTQLDVFNMEEFIEYIINKEVKALPMHIIGTATSLLANLPLLLATLYSHVKDSAAHGHSVIEVILDLLAIGGPFTLMGCAAYLDMVKEILNGRTPSYNAKIGIYFGAVISSLFTGIGAYILHSAPMHHGADEHGGGLLGFVDSLRHTFWYNIVSARERSNTALGKGWAVFNEAWKKFGILGVHGFLGYYAANVFLRETNLSHITALNLSLKISLPLLVTVFEGNSEARALDAYNAGKLDDIKRSTWLFVFFSALLHSIGPIVACASMIHSTSKEDESSTEMIYRILALLFASLLFLYPSIEGAAKLTARGTDDFVKVATKKVKKWYGDKQEGYQDIDAQVPKTSTRNWLCFWSCGKKEEQQPLPVQGVDKYELGYML